MSAGPDRRRRLALWLRWSARDLRARWLLVASIALIIGLGTGLFAGLGSMATWRRLSYDASYERLRLHDVEVATAAGTTVDQGRLLAVLDRLDDPGAVQAAEERLLVDTQFDASTDDRTVLVGGRISGSGTAERPPTVDRTHLLAGTDVQHHRGDRPVVLLDSSLARQYHLPDTGTLVLAGGTRVPWIGHALAPEWFVVTDPRAGTLALGSYGVLHTTLADAQTLAGKPGQVSSLVIRLAPGARRSAVVADLEAALTAGDEPIAATVTTRDDLTSYHLMYQDIEGDQEVWNAVSLIVLAGAAFAAANLVNRIIEAQRREIGVGMALGARPAQLAIRPLLVGVQVGLLGVALGIAVGLVVTRVLVGVFDDIIPLPVWLTPFQYGRFARAAALGLVLPLLATIYPVVRAVRVPPVDALQTTKPVSGRNPLARLARGFRLRGPSVRLLPVRDLIRSPRRTVFTAVGVAAAISVLVGVMGMMDSYFDVISRAEAELTGGLEQVNVDLEGFPTTTADTVTSLTGLDSVARADASLLLPATVTAGGRQPIDTLIEILDLDPSTADPGGPGAPDGSELDGDSGPPAWQPSVASGRAPGEGEILLSPKAATDLDVGVGDRVTLTHLVLGADGGYAIEESPLRIAGLHANPLRAFAYLDDVEAGRFGLAGRTNELRLTPAPGHTVEEVQRAAFGAPGVSAARSMGNTAQLLRDLIDQYIGILRVVQAIPLALALLVAFNSSTIGADERRRDHATMFAFGLRPRRVLGLLTVESLATGILGTALGLGAGWLLAEWVMGSIVPRTMPELAVATVISPTTVLVAGVAGVVVVGLAPVLVYRRLTRLDVPASLRVVE